MRTIQIYCRTANNKDDEVEESFIMIRDNHGEMQTWEKGSLYTISTTI